MKRVKTGIHGLDELIEGGFVKGHTVLISGRPGAGKTIFGLQYLYQGIQDGEAGVFLTFEQRKEEIIRDANRFGWDFDDTVEVVEAPPYNFDDILDIIGRSIKNTNAKRFVLDSTSTLALYLSSPRWSVAPKTGAGLILPNTAEIKRKLYELVHFLKDSNVTSILTSEVVEENKLSRYGVEEFVSDGVISLQRVLLGNMGQRMMAIEKMRETKFNYALYDFEITDKGIKLQREG